MYGKVFESIYDGTLAGHWQAIVTMQQLIVLATPDGVVDMTPDAIARRTSIPLHIINAGLVHLAQPDPHSRTFGEDGKRIVLLDDHRPWGWRLVNHAKYMRLRDMEQKRANDRERIAEKRKKNNSVAIVSQSVANVAHSDSDSDSDSDKDSKGKSNVGLKPDPDQQIRKNGRDQIKTRELRVQALEALGFLNEKTGRNYQPVPANVDMIVARLKEGNTVEDCRAVIAKKCREWGADERMSEYLRPATLFNRTKFAQYRGEIGNA